MCFSTWISLTSSANTNAKPATSEINCLDSCQMRFSAWFLMIYSKVLCVSHPGSHWRQGLANADVKPATSEDELF